MNALLRAPEALILHDLHPAACSTNREYVCAGPWSATFSTFDVLATGFMNNPG